MKIAYNSVAAGLVLGLVALANNALAHDTGSLAGTPVCLESNLMIADAMNTPFSNTPGVGRVLEMNTTTGERGITVINPLTPANVGTPICDNGGVSCPGPWKPTGILSGGENGHAYLTSAAQHALIEHHRDGTAIRTAPTLPTSPSPHGGNFGFVPRLLGNGFMPNGNIAQAVCDANFFNATNSDRIADGEQDVKKDGNSSWQFFPPVYGTDGTDEDDDSDSDRHDGGGGRAANGRVLVLDQTTLETIDEYSRPTEGPYANDRRWNCPAGVIFTSEGLFVSMFHGDAVFVIDWKDGIDNGKSEGVGSNSAHGFKLGKKKNQARIIRVIDLADDNGAGAADAPNYDSGHRRDNLRAIRMSEDGTLFGTRRSRSRECLRGEAPGAGPNPCNPSVFRQHVFVAAPGANYRTGSLALDPGVNILAGVTINRMSGPGCAYVEKEELVTTGSNSGDACDVETLYLGVSAGNAGCDGKNGPGHPANRCFVPGGTIYEYRIDLAHLDGGRLAGDGSGRCNGDPNDQGGNKGCALPIAQFDFVSDGMTSGLPAGEIEKIDPRMVMTIHEAFTQ
jgi:hypothetical protein